MKENYDELLDIIAKGVMEITHEPVNGDINKNFIDLGFDSLNFILLLCCVERDCGESVDFAQLDFDKICTVKKLADYLAETL